MSVVVPLALVEVFAAAANPNESAAADSVARAVLAMSDGDLAQLHQAIEVLRIAVVCERSDRKNRRAVTDPGQIVDKAREELTDEQHEGLVLLGRGGPRGWDIPAHVGRALVDLGLAYITEPDGGPAFVINARGRTWLLVERSRS